MLITSERKLIIYDTTIFNMESIVTISKIESHIGHWSIVTEGHYAIVWFYINGYIKIEERGEDREVIHNDGSAYKSAERDRKKLYSKIKKLRDELIKKLKED